MLTTVARCRSRSKAAIALHGAPEFIRSDNGTEFIAKELQRWLAEQKIKTLYITPASPWARRRYESLLMIARSALERDIVMNGPDFAVLAGKHRGMFRGPSDLSTGSPRRLGK
jgi:transposase InsO family protein